jgi:hypothetical protein
MTTAIASCTTDTHCKSKNAPIYSRTPRQNQPDPKSNHIIHMGPAGAIGLDANPNCSPDFGMSPGWVERVHT